MVLEGGISCIKYLLFCFNLLFVISGLIIFITGLIVEVGYYAHYMEFAEVRGTLTSANVLIAIGVIVFIVAFLGCCGAVKENHCMIITFSVLLLLIFIMELAVGIAGYVAVKDISLGEVFNTTMSEYKNGTDDAKVVDRLQTELHCCGKDSYTDWALYNKTIPDSCCSALPIDAATNQVEKCDATSTHLYKDGCAVPLEKILVYVMHVVGGVGLGIAITQLLGVVFACVLARSIRREYETV